MGLESKVWRKESVGEWEHYMQPLTFPGQHGFAFLFSLNLCFHRGTSIKTPGRGPCPLLVSLASQVNL